MRRLLVNAAKALRDKGTAAPAVDRPELYRVTTASVLLPNDVNGIEATLDAQWKELQGAFPGGVCDYSKPGVSQHGATAWLTYQDAKGRAIYGGRPLGPAPVSSYASGPPLTSIRRACFVNKILGVCVRRIFIRDLQVVLSLEDARRLV